MATALDAAAFRRAMQAFEEALRTHREEINSLNVYPVPDGDTGTNMLLTQEAVAAALAAAPAADGLRDTGQTVSRASLMGARGNSGVILAQALRGMCEEMPASGGIGPAELAAGLVRGAEGAYRAVARPAEGTALSVLRDAARAATDTSESGADVLAVTRAALEAARRSLADTPKLLPELQRAGVVDAGGKGVVLLLDALRAALAGDGLSEPVASLGPVGRWGPPNNPEASETTARDHPFEVQYLLEAKDEQVTALRTELMRLGESVVVVGGGGLFNVHVHTSVPDGVVEAGRRVGRIPQFSVTPLLEQRSSCLAGQARAVRVAEHPVKPACGLVAVVEGDGLSRIFASLGAVVIAGGPANPPSVGDLLAAMRAAGGDGVIVLPNNRSLVPAAERAAAKMGATARVLPVDSIPAGMAAATAFNAFAPLELNETSVRKAAEHCRSGELFWAERDEPTAAGPVRRGQWLAAAGGGVIRMSDTAAEVAAEVVRRLAPEEAEIVTVIVGAHAPAAEREEVGAVLRRSFPGVHVDVIEGGQPRPPFLIGVE